MSKTCNRCGAVYPSAEGFFHRSGSRQGRTLYRPECKQCALAAIDRQKRREYHKRYQALNAARIRETKRRYYAENRDHVLALRKARYDADPKRHIERVIRYRALTRGSVGAEKIDRGYVYERDGGRCHICGRKVPRARFELDHLIPASRGGPHTHANLRVAHRSCNASRNDGRLPAQLLLVT